MAKKFNILPLESEASGRSSCGPVQINVQTTNYELKPGSFRGRAAVVTLGCAKNQVDSEVMLGVLKNSGFEIVTDISRADVAVVNTCGFLESATKESIDAILEVAEYKKTGQLRKLIMAGCLVSRYQGELKNSLTEVDAFISTEEILKVGAAACGEVNSLLEASARPYFLYDDSMPRLISNQPHMAYIKVAEGCNRPCTFCIIPKIRGSMRSRPLDSIVRETQNLGRLGVREINLVAQDLTAYGSDIQGPRLAELLRALNDTQAVDWIRLLYAYPIGIDQELLKTIVELPRVCNYLDLPLQHSSERLLKLMQRPLGKYSPRKIAELITNTSPEIALRTTFIVGFPGETEDDIKDLESFVSAGHFWNVGVFTYSAEPGTPAAQMSDQVPEALKNERRARIMLAQQAVNETRLSEFVGKQVKVLIEGPHSDTDLLLSARAEFQAPEVDGSVIINDLGISENQIAAGVFGQVEITEFAGYDLIGSLVLAENRDQAIVSPPLPPASLQRAAETKLTPKSNESEL